MRSTSLSESLDHGVGDVLDASGQHLFTCATDTAPPACDASKAGKGDGFRWAEFQGLRASSCAVASCAAGVELQQPGSGRASVHPQIQRLGQRHQLAACAQRRLLTARPARERWLQKAGAKSVMVLAAQQTRTVPGLRG